MYEQDYAEKRRCGDCDIEYDDGGADECPYCGSVNTEIIDPYQEEDR